MGTAEKSKNILVILPNPMGDAILCTPALGRLRSCLPGARLTFMGKKIVAEVLAGNPGVDKWLIRGDAASGTRGFLQQVRLLKSQGFDAAILLPNSFRTALLVRLAGIDQRIGYDRDGRGFLLTERVQPIRLVGRFAPISMLDYYGFLIDQAIKILSGRSVNQIDSNRQLELFTSNQDKNEIDELFKGWGLSTDKRLVIMVPGGAFGPSKLWQPERFAELADRLIEENNCEVIISAAPNEAEKRIAGQIVSRCHNKVHNLGEAMIGLKGKDVGPGEKGVSLGGLKELIRRCGLMVSNDTGPCHIAAAFGVPLVTLFGPTDPRWTATGYAREIRLREDVPCGPCQQEICREERHLCMEKISVNQVHAGAVELLSGRGKSELSDRQSGSETGAEKSGFDAARYYSVFDEQFVPLSDGSGLIHQDYQELLRSNRLDSCESVFSYAEGDHRVAEGECLNKRGSEKQEQLRLELSDAAGKSTIINLKRFRRASVFSVLGRWLIRRSRASAAVFDFAAIMQLAEKGSVVPRPIAFGQEQGRLGEIRSFVMIEELPRRDKQQVN
ncbi:MAG: lipopolysaccharide heptosyltransferase II [Sedimentisphaerales bacterium]|nr:lipopolysaccharide heptosyltransferase II [Sedimentisphaerales bacterium]